MARGRTRIQTEGRFSTSDAAEATGLSPSKVIYLCAEGEVPVVSGGGGSGSHRELDFPGLAFVAVAGAFYAGGLEIKLASRLVRQIRSEARFAELSNLEYDAQGRYAATVRLMQELGWDANDPCMLHKALRTKTNSYRKYAALDWDYLFEVVDRSFVYRNRLRPLPGGNALAPSTDNIAAMYRISGLAKGRSIKLEEAPPHSPRRLPKDWARARENFRGMISINASLAIRDALDRVADARLG